MEENIKTKIGVKKNILAITSIVLFCCLFSFTSIGIVEAAQDELTLRAAIKSAMENNKSLKAQEQNAISTHNKSSASKSSAFPTASVGYNSEYSSFDSNHVLNPNGNQRSENTTLGISQDLNLPKHISNFKVQNLNAKIADLEVEDKRQSVILSTINAYNKVIATRNELKLYSENVNSFMQHVKMSEKQLELGEISAREMAKAQAKLSEQIYKKVNAEGNYEIAKEDFHRITGVSATDNMTIDESISDLLPKESTMDDFKTLGISNNIALKVLREKKDLVKHAGRLEKAGMFGSYRLTVGSSIQSNSSSAGATGADVGKEFVNLSLSLPFFQSGAFYFVHKKGVSDVAASGYNYHFALNATLKDIASDYLQVKASDSSIKATADLVKAKQLELKATKREVDLKLRTFIDELDAQTDLTDAKLQLMTSRLNKIYYSYSLFMRSQGVESINRIV
ncbi:TolC family protein [Anaplasmataceae bacterium AB001_6]|nr:TolC family protein [Anaplasmataceae bacterium AB001_6]